MILSISKNVYVHCLLRARITKVLCFFTRKKVWLVGNDGVDVASYCLLTIANIKVREIVPSPQFN